MFKNAQKDHGMDLLLEQFMTLSRRASKQNNISNGIRWKAKHS